MEIAMTPRRSVFNMTNFWFLVAMTLFVVQYGRFYPSALEVLRPFALLAFGLAGMIFLSGKQIIYWKYSQMQAIWLTVIWMIVSIPFAMNYGNAFMTTRNVMMFLPFMISIIILINDVQKLKILVNVVIGVAILNAIRGYLMFDGPGRNTMFNLGAFLGDPNDYSLYMNMMIPFAYFMFLQELKWNYKKIIYGLAALVMVAMVIMSFSRGGMVGLACVGLVMWYYSPNRAATFSVGVLVLIGVLFMSGDAWLATMSSTTDLSNSTVQSRFTNWSATISMFIDNPVAGVGVSNVPFYLSDYVPRHFTYQFQVAHSIWFTALAEGGIIGFTLFVWLLITNWSGASRLARVRPMDHDARYLKYFGAATLGSLVAYMASGSFLTVNYYPHLWYLTAFIVVGIKVLNNHHVRYHVAAENGWFG